MTATFTVRSKSKSESMLAQWVPNVENLDPKLTVALHNPSYTHIHNRISLSLGTAYVTSTNIKFLAMVTDSMEATQEVHLKTLFVSDWRVLVCFGCIPIDRSFSQSMTQNCTHAHICLPPSLPPPPNTSNLRPRSTIYTSNIPSTHSHSSTIPSPRNGSAAVSSRPSTNTTKLRV